jgi:hypothetical protein
MEEPGRRMTDKEPEYYLITPNELFLFGVDGTWDREERTRLYDVVKSRPYHLAPDIAPDISLPLVAFKIGKPSFPCITERELAINDITPDGDDFSRLNISIETGDLICIYRGEDVISEQEIRQSEREKVINRAIEKFGEWYDGGFARPVTKEHVTKILVSLRRKVEKQ